MLQLQPLPLWTRQVPRFKDQVPKNDSHYQIIISSVLLAFCPKSNILTRANVQIFSSPAAPFSDFSRAYQNMRGENLITSGPYIINIFFNNHICVSDVIVQRTAPGRDTSNVEQIEISYKSSDRTELKNPDGTSLVLRSPIDNPTVTDDPIRCKVQGIDVRVLKTTNANKPSFVRLMVIGCYAPSKLYLTIET